MKQKALTFFVFKLIFVILTAIFLAAFAMRITGEATSVNVLKLTGISFVILFILTFIFQYKFLFYNKELKDIKMGKLTLALLIVSLIISVISGFSVSYFAYKFANDHYDLRYSKVEQIYEQESLNIDHLKDKENEFSSKVDYNSQVTLLQTKMWGAGMEMDDIKKEKSNNIYIKNAGVTVAGNFTFCFIMIELLTIVVRNFEIQDSGNKN